MDSITNINVVRINSLSGLALAIGKELIRGCEAGDYPDAEPFIPEMRDTVARLADIQREAVSSASP